MTNEQRITDLERQVKFLEEMIEVIAEQARKGQSAWQMQQPIGGLRKVPMSPEFPDIGYFLEPDVESKSLRDRIK